MAHDEVGLTDREPNGQKIELLSDEEDAVLTAAAFSDPDNQPVTDFSGFKRMGRPPLADPKLTQP